MLKVRIVPTLLLRQGRCVKGKRFADYRDVGNPVQAARVYSAQNADELIFLDITASQDHRSILFDLVARTAEECFMPLTVGGGVRSVDDVRTLLKNGADKVSINTAAIERPSLIREAADRFGSNCVVVSIDVRCAEPGDYRVFTHGGRRATGLHAYDWARQAVSLGAGELLVTSIDREGTGEGYDLELVRTVADLCNVPVIAHGGAGTLRHFVEAVRDGHASAVAAASIFHFSDQSVIKARAHMKHAGVDVRNIV